MRSSYRDDEAIWRKKFGDKLRRLIHIKNTTQGRLAAEVGVTEATLSWYITGTHTPSGYMMQRLANALGCDVNCLYEVDDL